MSRNVVEKFVTRIRHLARIECRYFDIRILIIALSIIPEENRGGQKSIWHARVTSTVRRTVYRFES